MSRVPSSSPFPCAVVGQQRLQTSVSDAKWAPLSARREAEESQAKRLKLFSDAPLNLKEASNRVTNVRAPLRKPCCGGAILIQRQSTDSESEELCAVCGGLFSRLGRV